MHLSPVEANPLRCAGGLYSQQLLEIKLQPGSKQLDSRIQARDRSCCAGVGYKMDQQLAAMGVQTVQDLRQLSAVQLHRSFGERTAAFLTAACLGQASLAQLCQCTRQLYIIFKML